MSDVDEDVRNRISDATEVLGELDRYIDKSSTQSPPRKSVQGECVCLRAHRLPHHVPLTLRLRAPSCAVHGSCARAQFCELQMGGASPTRRAPNPNARQRLLGDNNWYLSSELQQEQGHGEEDSHLTEWLGALTDHVADRYSLPEHRERTPKSSVYHPGSHYVYGKVDLGECAKQRLQRNIKKNHTYGTNSYAMALGQLCFNVNKEKRQLSRMVPLPPSCSFQHMCVPTIGSIPLAVGIAENPQLAKQAAAKQALFALGMLPPPRVALVGCGMK